MFISHLCPAWFGQHRSNLHSPRLTTILCLMIRIYLSLGVYDLWLRLSYFIFCDVLKGRKCTANYCKKGKHDGTLVIYGFSKDPTDCNEWVASMQNKIRKVTVNIRVCSLHWSDGNHYMLSCISLFSLDLCIPNKALCSQQT